MGTRPSAPAAESRQRTIIASHVGTANRLCFARSAVRKFRRAMPNMWMEPITATPAGPSVPSAEPSSSTKRTLLLTMRATKSFYVTTAMRKRLYIVRSAVSTESAKIWRLSGSVHGRTLWPTPHNGGKL